MNISLSGKVAVVTGGASGIGRAIAQLFANAEAHVHIIDLKEAESTAAEITNTKGMATGHSCDVSSQKDVNRIMDSIQRMKPIEILVNCAGIAHVGNLDKTTEAAIDRLFQVNVKGVYNTMLACISNMKERGSGVILNMASVAGSVGVPDRFAYSMTKGAVIAMTISVARDYVQHGIRCNCISPARIHTPFVDGFLSKNYPGIEKEMFGKLSKTQPIGRMGTPEEIAQLALYLCSDQASFITGTDYPIDGGFIKLSAG